MSNTSTTHPKFDAHEMLDQFKDLARTSARYSAFVSDIEDTKRAILGPFKAPEEEYPDITQQPNLLATLDMLRWSAPFSLKGAKLDNWSLEQILHELNTYTVRELGYKIEVIRRLFQELCEVDARNDISINSDDLQKFRASRHEQINNDIHSLGTLMAAFRWQSWGWGWIAWQGMVDVVDLCDLSDLEAETWREDLLLAWCRKEAAEDLIPQLSNLFWLMRKVDQCEIDIKKVRR